MCWVSSKTSCYDQLFFYVVCYLISTPLPLLSPLELLPFRYSPLPTSASQPQLVNLPKIIDKDFKIRLVLRLILRNLIVDSSLIYIDLLTETPALLPSLALALIFFSLMGFNKCPCGSSDGFASTIRRWVNRLPVNKIIHGKMFTDFYPLLLDTSLWSLCLWYNIPTKHVACCTCISWGRNKRSFLTASKNRFSNKE